MYHSLSFGTSGTTAKNTTTDWYLIPTTRPLVNPPAPKTNFVDVPGGNGSLDFSETLTGYPVYETRTGSWEFVVQNGKWSSWTTAYSTIMSYLHGRRMKVVLEDDPYYYYEGRFSVNSWKSDADWSTITIDYVLDPFKKSIQNSLGTLNFNPFKADVSTLPKIEAYTHSTTSWSSAQYLDVTTNPRILGAGVVTPTWNVTLQNSGTAINIRLYNPELWSNYKTGVLNKNGNIIIPEFTLSNLNGTNRPYYTVQNAGTVRPTFTGGSL